MSKSSCTHVRRWLPVGALLVAWTAAAQVWEPVRVQMVPIGSSTELPVVAERLGIEIDGQNAEVKLQQTFHNSTGTNVEGRYTLWAGPGARANGFAYWNGEQKIVGEVFEKNTARQVYQRVVSRRRDPGLLEEQSDGQFSFVVSPIVPDERKRVEVAYSRWLPRRNGIVDVHAPVTRPDAEITVTVNDKRQLKGFASSTHQIEVKQLGSGKILIRAAKARGDAKHFALQYEVVERPWSVNAYVHQNKGQDAYFALTLASPSGTGRSTLPKDVTLVIDRSGSMAGDKLKQARQACLDVLNRLGEHDRVNVMAFDDRIEQLFKTPEPVTKQVRNRAIEYVELIQDGGGTSLDGALIAALSSQVEGPQPRVVLFFTDGQSPADPVIAAANRDNHDVRVFTIGIGRQIDRALLSRLAALKRGRFTYVSEHGNLEREVASLYSQIESPLLIDVSLETKNGNVMSTYPRAIPDLFNHDELLITGRLRGKGTVELVLNAKQDGKPVAFRTEVSLSDEILRPWVGRLWAKSRIDDLLDEISLKGPNHELSDEVTELALAYNFVTPYTSFLAIPESEVDAVSAQELATARARKQEVMKRKSGAAQLSGAEGGNEVAGESAAAPAQIAAPSPVVDRGDVEPLSDLAQESDDMSGEPMSRKATMQDRQVKKGGCASCDLGGRAASSEVGFVSLLLAAAGLLFVTSKSRRRRGR